MIEDWHTLTGAYALDALSEVERRRFRAHMAVCPSCAQEVAEFRETAARLGSIAATVPPPGLRGRVLASIAQTRQLPPESPRSRPRLRRWPARIGIVAAAASVVGAVLFGLLTNDANQRLTDELGQAQGELDQVRRILDAPDVRAARAEATGGGTVTALVSRNRDEVLFLARGLPRIPADRAYQLWMIGGGGVRSAGLLTAEAHPVLATGVPAGGKIGLTVEPAGGSPSPTTTPILLVDMPT
jgi:anti-sigma-K factor RskA